MCSAARSCRPGLDRFLECHRHARDKKENVANETCRNENVDHRSPEIDLEVPHVRVAAQPADHRHKRAQTNAAAQEHIPNDDGELAEVRQVYFTGIVLLAVVGHEGEDGVKNR